MILVPVCLFGLRRSEVRPAPCHPARLERESVVLTLFFYLSISLSLSTKACESVVISLSPAWKFFVCNVYGGNGGPAGRDVFPIFSGSHSSLDIYCIGSEFSASGRMFPSSPGSPSVHLSFVPPSPSLLSHINVVGGTYGVTVQSKPAHCIRTYVYTYMNGIHCLRSVGTGGREILYIELPTSTRIYSHLRHVCTHISPSGMSRSVGRIDIC